MSLSEAAMVLLLVILERRKKQIHISTYNKHNQTDSRETVPGEQLYFLGGGSVRGLDSMQSFPPPLLSLSASVD